MAKHQYLQNVNNQKKLGGSLRAQKYTPRFFSFQVRLFVAADHFETKVVDLKIKLCFPICLWHPQQL